MGHSLFQGRARVLVLHHDTCGCHRHQPAWPDRCCLRPARPGPCVATTLEMMSHISCSAPFFLFLCVNSGRKRFSFFISFFPFFFPPPHPSGVEGYASDEATSSVHDPSHSRCTHRVGPLRTVCLFLDPLTEKICLFWILSRRNFDLAGVLPHDDPMIVESLVLLKQSLISNLNLLTFPLLAVGLKTCSGWGTRWASPASWCQARASQTTTRALFIYFRDQHTLSPLLSFFCFCSQASVPRKKVKPCGF